MEETGLDFYDILREIDKGKTKVRCVSFDGGGWGNVFLNLQSGKYFLSDNHKEFYPTPEDMLKKTWEIEPEKPEEVFVWGTCEENGESWVWGIKPRRQYYDGRPSGWQASDGEYGGRQLKEKNLFPKDKPQRYRLVLVEEKK